MPFNKDTAAAAGNKGGGKRWSGKDPGTVRNKQLKISLTQAEYEAVSKKAAAISLQGAAEAFHFTA